MEDYIVYPRRWAVLLCVTFINMSNAAVWISFFPVATMTVEYFDKSAATINWFSTVFMIVPILCFVITTYISNAKGLKLMVHIGCTFNFVGALIKAFGTSSLIDNKDTQFTVTLIGQTVAAVAQTFTIYVPTKVSQVWFPEKERWFITTILAISYSTGIVLTQLITPLVIKSSEGIPTIDYICLGFAAVVQMFTIVFMTRSEPITPPSKASDKSFQSITYFQQLKVCFSSLSFVSLLMMISSGIGIIAGLNTLTQQIICSVGYSNELAGILIFVMYGIGYIGAFILQPLIERFGNYEACLKVAIACSSLGYIGISEVVLIPNIKGLLVFFYMFYGIFAVGIFPLGLELCVEATYPVDESMTTGLVYLFGQFFAILIIIIVPALALETGNTEHDVCNLSVSQSHKDYSWSVSAAMMILCFISIVSILLYKPVFKRKDYERSKLKEDINNTENISKYSNKRGSLKLAKCD